MKTLKNSRQNRVGHVGQYAEDAWSLAQRTAKGLNEIRKLINIETKLLPALAAQTTFSNVGTIVPISEIAQGLDYNTRVGDSIKIQKIIVNVRLLMAAAATQTFARVVMFRDLQNTGTAPTVANLLQTTDTCSPVNFLFHDRFTILWDELVPLCISGDQNAVLRFDRPHGGHVKYLGITAAAASDGQGSIYLLFISNETAANVPSYSFISHVYFTDD